MNKPGGEERRGGWAAVAGRAGRLPGGTAGELGGGGGTREAVEEGPREKKSLSTWPFHTPSPKFTAPVRCNLH